MNPRSQIVELASQPLVSPKYLRDRNKSQGIWEHEEAEFYNYHKQSRVVRRRHVGNIVTTEIPEGLKIIPIRNSSYKNGEI